MTRWKFIMAVIGVLIGLSGARYGWCVEIGNDVECALLKGDWVSVVDAIQKDDGLTANPAARLIMAHAKLATNANNEATILFLAIEKEDIEAWKAWTEMFSAQNPKSAVAHYLHGDALARAGKLKEALNSFNRVLEIDPKESLFWNARGVTKAISGDMDGALLDITRAIELRRDFADAHANIGTLWVLRGAAPGAIEAFDRALAINPAFALAYNGRACARFGQGDYEGAIEDFEKCFELCPALVPAGANQSLALAAIESETMPYPAAVAKPGTTIMTKSELARVDCSKFKSYQQIWQYEDSVRTLAKTDVTEAIRVLSAQRSGLTQSREQLGNDLTRFVRAGKQANDIANTLRGVDNFLSMVPVTGIKTNIVSDKGWKVPLDIAGKGAGIAGTSTEPGTALNMWSNVASRTLTPEIASGLGSLKALTRVSSYLLNEGLYVPRTIADAKAMETAARINLLTIQESRLQQLQGEFIAGAIRQNVDFSKIGLTGTGLGGGKISTTNPLREYRIPATAQLTAFATMPGATGKGIAPSGQSAFVLVQGGELTDPQRLGAALRGYDALGARTISVPKGTDPTHLMNTLGLSAQNTILMKVTAGADPQWQPYNMPTMSSGPPPGGVTTEFRPRIDRGDWPVMTSFVLAYNPVEPTTRQSTKESEN